METTTKLIFGGVGALIVSLAGYFAYLAIAGSIAASLAADPGQVQEQIELGQLRNQCQEAGVSCPTPQATYELIEEDVEKFKAVPCQRAGNIVQQFIFELLKHPAAGFDGYFQTSDGQTVASISNPPYNGYLLISGRTDVVGEEILNMSGAKTKWEWVNSLKALRGNAQVSFYAEDRQFEARIPTDRSQWGCGGG